MKTGRLVNLTALVCAAALAVYFGMRCQRFQRELAALQRRTAVGMTRKESLERDMRELEQRLAVVSQRLCRAEAQYEEEQKTHDPLRAQISKMSAQGLRHAREAAQNQERIQQLQKALIETETKQRAALADNQNLAAEKQDLLGRLKNSEVERLKGDEAQAGLRDRLATAGQLLASMSNELAVTRANAEEAFRTIADQLSKIRDLQARLAASAPPSADGLTNAPSPVAVPESRPQ